MSAVSSQSPDAVDRLEKQLKVSLRLVEPRTEFVDHLHNRLTTAPDTTLERRQGVALSMLLISFSLLSGCVILWLMHRLRTAE